MQYDDRECCLMTWNAVCGHGSADWRKGFSIRKVIAVWKEGVQYMVRVCSLRTVTEVGGQGSVV